MIIEGSFVMGMTSEGIVYGMVEHIMTEGGVYGTPGTEYAIQSMPPENPAMAVRIYEEENGTWEATAYSIGMMYRDATLVNIADHSMKSETPMDVAYNAIVTDPMPANPSPHINPSVGMKKPQSMTTNQGRPTGSGINNKPGVDIWSGSAFGKAEAPLPENPIMPTNTYQGCECDMCEEEQIKCASCPLCSGLDAETQMAMFDSQLGKSECCPDKISKQDPCWDGYVQRGMKPGDNGKPVPNCVPAAKADDLFEDDDTVEYDTDEVSKAEGYSPPAGARSAARRAIKFKEDGKAKGAGTSVGWTRAGQLARGETISLSTVKRMYSYFSRHEVDKKGKDWGNSSNPSNGYIMWLAWGGDAGYSWSRGIANRERDKALFANFGKDYTKNQTERHSL